MKVASLRAENLPACRRFRGKGPDDESFPLSPRLIPSRLRSEILAFYRFARLAGNIADDPELSAEQKTAWLEALDAVLDGRSVVAYARGRAGKRVRQRAQRAFAAGSCAARDPCGFGDHDAACAHILQAFGQDAVQRRYRGCKEDYLWFERVYLPENWLDAAATTPDSLTHPAASPELRRVLDQTLEGVLRLIRAARPLPRRIRNRGLRLKAAVILVMAEMLAAKLGKQDPLAQRVALSKPEWLWAGLRGIVRGLTGR